MEDLEFIKERVKFYLQHETEQHFIDLARDLQANADGSLLRDLFGSSIKFGTGGLRGVMQPGFNSINPLTIHLASQGLGLYARSLYKRPLTAIISYDTRLYSKEFAVITARTLATMGIHVKIFMDPTPVPILSFSIREEEADFGVMITASHNPKEYNGYKVYWGSGEQVTAPHDTGIEQSIAQVKPDAVITEKEAQSKDLWTWIDDSLFQKYHDAIFELELLKFLYPTAKSTITSTICYSPLHGSGYKPVVHMLESAGFTVSVPAEQAEPDGNFPTVKTPNPEDSENLELAIDLAKKEGASLVLATDPDADRLGVAVKHHDDFIILTGNQIGALMLYFIAEMRKKANLPSDRSLFVNTVVTSPLQNKIAQAYHISDTRVLTGFKFIAEVIAWCDKKKSKEYIFGCEESYGFLIHTLCRDKDAVSAALLIALMHEHYAKENTSLITILDHLHASHGYHLDRQINYTLNGTVGTKAIEAMMDQLAREKPQWGDSPITRVYDYRQQQVFTSNGEVIPTEEPLPQTNLLQFELEDGTLISARPSGTEPKIKFYTSITAKNEEEAEIKMGNLKTQIHLFVAPYL
ncbi:phospho-sugar mutase [Entomospira entomophila]|uniref:Phospho-sugar mutase n=1 Tax=Entomospira entomophila TaxID=2719988 RepID=A0A968GAB3_9SPIO|nr:phospho-sugar mutase [Entomospira entomophilus]NIZ40822.1 phospho-sugar mutase [Entomospira entomophilus]WDI35034.1 phospho-sugar mutase [Entomospira entomophilus]